MPALSPQPNTAVRNRLRHIAETLETIEAAHIDTVADTKSFPITAVLCGPHIRRRPEYQKRDLDTVVYKTENRNIGRRFGLLHQAAKFAARLLRNDLMAQGWDGQSKAMVISDGESALPNLVRGAVNGPVAHILDWWHISMRVKHVENAVKGLLQTEDLWGLLQLFERPATTVRWNLWHGAVMTATTNLKVRMIDCDRLHAKSKEQRAAVRRVIAQCRELYTYFPTASMH